jgi:triosephosphate isomerase
VRFAEIGHAERRALFGETPELTMRKAVASVQQGLTPLLCVGEGRLGQRDQVPALDAAEQVAGQLDEMLAALPTEAPVLVAYEPVWAIGADRPAPVEHVRTVAHRLRVRLGAHPRARLIYGGTAGPGLFAQVGDCLDGLFLGRRAHDPAALGAVLAEVAAGVSAG